MQSCKLFKFVVWPRSPTCSVTAQFILRRWKIVASWCCADFQQRSNERMVVLPETQSSSFYGVKNFLRLDGMKLIKTFEVMAGPCFSKHSPALFTVLKNFFVWMSCSHLETFKFKAGPRSPRSSVTTQLISRRWRIISFWCYADFQQRSNKRMVVLF